MDMTEGRTFEIRQPTLPVGRLERTPSRALQTSGATLLVTLTLHCPMNSTADLHLKDFDQIKSIPPSLAPPTILTGSSNTLLMTRLHFSS